MLYKKNNTPKLDMNLFKNPTAEYRGAPFWAWNCELEEDELLRQIECLKEMGLGGFHMHSRSGMATRYLSPEFMKLVRACVDKAKKENMLAWLYDEDRWPSGSAGGYVTKNREFREHMVVFTTKKIDNVSPKEEAVKSGDTYLLASYDIVLNSKGELESYNIFENGKTINGVLWNAYVKTAEPRGWINGESYVDTLNPKAMQKFLEITHEEYKKCVGDEFGKTVPSIFTDEPQFVHKSTLPFAESTEDVILPWTPDFDETYASAYGEDIIKLLPELIWELKDGAVSTARYHYHDHICERFTIAFSDQIGNWCKGNGIFLTGHMMEEPTLKRQTAAIGEAMRAYRSFELPGVDILMNEKEYSTVKQAQSASRQYGREGVMSELYGVTNWDFDFRGHKSQGDWQAAMGVTTRVHHLSWVSMKGSAKRDYPASINYQSPWYKEYPRIEDHFARINTVMTRGKACVNVGVIHPIESYWLHWGPSDNTSDIRKQMDDQFLSFIDWMQFGLIDFDFISESCMPSLVGNIDSKIAVGAMTYSAIVVPGCETLRKTTVDILTEFINKGGRVIFAGNCPKYMDAIPSEEVKALYKRAQVVPFDKQAILNALSDERDIEIKDDGGNTPDSFFYQLREDGDVKNLFIAHAKPIFDDYCKGTMPPTKSIIKIKGEYTPTMLDTQDGEEKNIDFDTKDGYTCIYKDFYEHDSLLVSLKPCTHHSFRAESENVNCIGEVSYKTKVSYEREEDNVCILDLAKYSLNGGEVCDTDEILQIDDKIRKVFGWPNADGQDVQPWVIDKEIIENYVTLYFTVNSEADFENINFCCEELTELKVNGQNIELKEIGYFVDKAIKKYNLPKLCKGKNEICITMPIGKRTSLEACYLTGDFDVRAEGCELTICAPTKKIGFGSITSQGLPFYGGNLTYSAKLKLDKKCNVVVNIGKYVGSLTKVFLDGKDMGAIIYAPYDLELKGVEAGEHTIEFKLFGNRYNTFGALHSCGHNLWYGPTLWYSKGNAWCYEYNTKPTGILKSPVIKLYEV